MKKSLSRTLLRLQSRGYEMGEQTSPNAVKKVGASIDKYLIRSEKFSDAMDALFGKNFPPVTGSRLNRPLI